MHTPRRWDTPLVERRWTVLAGLVVCLLAAFPYYESIRSANELPRLYQALAWLNDGVLYLDAPTLRGFDPGPDVSRGVGGHLFPNKPPGMSVIALAAVIAARLMEQVVGVEATLESATWWLRLLGGTLPLALLAWTSLRHEGLGVRRFWSQAGAVLLLCASTPLWSYGHLAYGNVWSAALLYWGVYNLVGSGERDRVPAPLWGGLLAGSAVLFEYIAAFAALPIAWMLLARTSAERGTRELVAACVGAAIPAAALLAYHDVAFGSPWSTGYHSAANPAFAAKHGAGLLGLVGPNMEAAEAQLWDPAAGLLWWAPGVLLGALGLARMSWGGVDEILRRRGRVLLGVFLTGVAVVVSLNFQGGWRVGPRYLVFVLPCLMPGVLYVLERDRSGAWTAAWACLVGLGAVGNVLAGTLWPHIDVARARSRPGAALAAPAGGRGPRGAALAVWDRAWQRLPGARTHVGVVRRRRRRSRRLRGARRHRAWRLCRGSARGLCVVDAPLATSGRQSEPRLRADAAGRESAREQEPLAPRVDGAGALWSGRGSRGRSAALGRHRPPMRSLSSTHRPSPLKGGRLTR